LANGKCRFAELQVFSFKFQAGLDAWFVLLSREATKKTRHGFHGFSRIIFFDLEFV